MILEASKLKKVERLFKAMGLLDAKNGFWVAHFHVDAYHRYVLAFSAHIVFDEGSKQKVLFVEKQYLYVDVATPDLRTPEEEEVPKELVEKAKKIEAQLRRLLFS